MKTFELTKSIIRMWMGKYGYIHICNICEKQFQEGDIVVSKQQKGTRNKRFHQKCLDKGSTPLSAPE